MFGWVEPMLLITLSRGVIGSMKLPVQKQWQLDDVVKFVRQCQKAEDIRFSVGGPGVWLTAYVLTDGRNGRFLTFATDGSVYLTTISNNLSSKEWIDGRDPHAWARSLWFEYSEP